MSSQTPVYSQPSAMEPLLPATSGERLAELTCNILLKGGSLSAQLPSPLVRVRVANLVREMNSYYSNLIEGHKTLPEEIERAMRADYSSEPEKRANQELNRAHIEVVAIPRSRSARALEMGRIRRM